MCIPVMWDVHWEFYNGKQNDWKAVEEITSILRNFNPEDPIQYDYALFGIGAFEGKMSGLPII